ncbi:ribonuclease H-like domain-containing protein, partial [Tanacetum coccineum]
MMALLQSHPVSGTNSIVSLYPVMYHTSLGPHVVFNTPQSQSVSHSPGVSYSHAHQAQPVCYTAGPLGPRSFFQQAQPVPMPSQPTSELTNQFGSHVGYFGPTVIPRKSTILPHAFNVLTSQDPGAWNIDTGASSYLNSSITSLSENFNTCMYSYISVGDGHSIPVTNTGHSILPTPLKSLHLTPSPILHAFLVSQHTWHQHLGHPGGEVLCHLISSNFISCNKENPPVLCHACQLGKHERLRFVSSSTVICSCFDIIHSDVWTSPISNLSG